METLESLKGKIKTTKNLQGIVSSMKTLSAVSISQYERASKALKVYNRNIKYGMKVALSNYTLPRERTKKYKGGVAILFGSDQGLVGRFNTSLAQFGQKTIQENPNIESPEKMKYIVIGRSMFAKFTALGGQATKLYSTPGSIAAVAGLAQIITLKIDELLEDYVFEKVLLFYNKRAGAGFESTYRRLLPMDEVFLNGIRETKWPTNQLPQTPVSGEQMFDSLVRQILFIEVYRALAESLASEHMTRMISMQNAEKNIEEHLDKMNLEYQQRRQAEITEELIDVVSGAEVLNAKKKKKK
ncbi:MAG: F0F1 ATP synthase subunit gamma [Alphaproteobacteria bacterium]|nr:F0F1 ATP synthase subunit gamma [Alphaproteobacteria bacterium]